MGYKISAGLPEADLSNWLKVALGKYGRYQNQGVDFTHADKAPIVMCTVKCQNEILLVKRGYGLADAEGYWSTVNGFIDHDKPVAEIAAQELAEELSLTVKPGQIKVGPSYTLQNPAEKRQYIVFPCLVELSNKPSIILNHENTDFRWIKRSELPNYNTLDDLSYSIDQALTLG